LVPRSLRLPLTAIQFATVAMLMRSVALDRWITVAACLLLLAGSVAGARGRTWGVALAFLIGITFVSIWMLGIAPGWFALVGLLAARPFARMFRHFLRFDWGAAAMLASGATVLGAALGVAWKAFAHDLFAALPLLIPSLEPHHGALVAAIGAAGTVAAIRQARQEKKTATAETEPVATRVRIAPSAPEAEAELLDADVDLEAERRRAL
jgi:hypothetical protein